MLVDYVLTTRENFIIKRFILETFIIVSIIKIALINFCKFFLIIFSIIFSFKLTFLYNTIRNLNYSMSRNLLFLTILFILILSQCEQIKTLML